MENVEIRIEGMSCGGCTAAVTRRLQGLPGVTRVEVSLQPGWARVSFDPQQTSLAGLQAEIEEAGFDVVA